MTPHHGSHAGGDRSGWPRVLVVEDDGDPRIVATLVGRLRARVEENPDEPRHIVTIRGVGYRYNDRS